MKGTVIVQLSSYMSIRLLLIMVTVRPQYGLLLRLSRLVGRGGSSCEAKTVCWVRHQDFPGGHPSQFHSGPSALNCRVLLLRKMCPAVHVRRNFRLVCKKQASKLATFPRFVPTSLRSTLVFSLATSLELLSSRPATTDDAGQCSSHAFGH